MWDSLKAVILSMSFPVVRMRKRHELKGKVHQLEDELASAQKQSGQLERSEDEVISSKILGLQSFLAYTVP